MRAETAGEESVAVGDLHDVVARDTVHGQAARRAVRPDVEVALGLRDADRLAGRARGAVEAVDLAHRRGSEAIGVLVAEIRLLHERELGEVLERHEVAGLYAFLVAAAAEQRHALVLVGDELLKLGELHCAQLLDGHEIGLRDRIDVRGHLSSSFSALSSEVMSASVPMVIRSRSPVLGPGK